jgi:hypothetical protein
MMTHLILDPVALVWVVPCALGLVALQGACLGHTSIDGIDRPLELVVFRVVIVDVVQPERAAHQAMQGCELTAKQQQQLLVYACHLGWPAASAALLMGVKR